MTTTDTMSLTEACEAFGISKSMGYRIARRSGELTKGVPILKFGTDTRPVYRVSRAAVEAAL